MAGAVIPVLQHGGHEVNRGRGGCCQILQKEAGLKKMETSHLFNVNAGFSNSVPENKSIMETVASLR